MKTDLPETSMELERRSPSPGVSGYLSGAPQGIIASGSEPRIKRVWAMPSHNTFDVPPIAGFVQKYLLKSKISIDPFARNKRWATHTNDLNPGTQAEHHMEALDFLEMLAERKVVADLVIFDPPYNPSQAKKCYESMGLANTLKSARSGGVWSDEKNAAAKLLSPDGVFLWFGWNTCGMGKGRGFEIIEILLVSHGRGKNDTICSAERRIDDGAVAPALLRDNAELRHGGENQNV